MVGRSTTPPARERLLDAAEELFYERGIAATGVDAVLTRARVAPATLYAHFTGKDQLVAEYLRRRHERWRGTWDEVLAARDDPLERVLSVFDALEVLGQRGSSRRGCAFLGAAVELPMVDHPAHAWLAADTRLLHQRLHQLARDSGAADPDALAAELLLLYDGALAARARADILSTSHDTAVALARRAAVAAVARHVQAERA